MLPPVNCVRLGVQAADGAGRGGAYLHGGAFVMCEPNSHSRIVLRCQDLPNRCVDSRLSG